MKRNLFFGTVATALLVLSSCSSKPLEKISVKDLSGEWTVVAVDGKDVTVPEGQTAPFLGFDTANGHMFGNASCNNIMGSFKTDTPAGEIALSGIASTRMGCPDLALEQSILASLDKVTAVGRETTGEVVLSDADGKALLTLKKQTPSITPASLEGEWIIKEINGTPTNAADSVSYVMAFDAASKSFSAKADCNIIGGNYTGDYIDIKLEPVSATTMECADMTAEQEMMKVLPTVTSFGELADGSMGFYNADNDLVLIIAKP